MRNVIAEISSQVRTCPLEETAPSVSIPMTAAMVMKTMSKILNSLRSFFFSSSVASDVTSRIVVSIRGILLLRHLIVWRLFQHGDELKIAPDNSDKHNEWTGQYEVTCKWLPVLVYRLPP